MNCIYCDHPIHPERVEALPGTRTCVNCSDVSRPMGYMDYGHKTAPSLVMIGECKESQRLAKRAFKRAR